MTTKTLFEQIEKRVKIIKKSPTPPTVVLPLRDWEMIEDMILELSSPQLLKSIKKARQDYKKGKGVRYHPV